jgi:hypothetical protein
MEVPTLVDLRMLSFDVIDEKDIYDCVRIFSFFFWYDKWNKMRRNFFFLLLLWIFIEEKEEKEI